MSEITLTVKTVMLKGFNDLKDGVKIEMFDLPLNDLAGGIHLTLDASMTNISLSTSILSQSLNLFMQLSQVGIELSSISFEIFVSNIMIAPVSSTDVVTLAPTSTSDLLLVGHLVPQSSPSRLSAVSGIFNNFVQDKDSIIIVCGASAEPQDVCFMPTYFSFFTMHKHN